MEPQTKEGLAYDKLKTMILGGELPQNTFLSQRMLANSAGTTTNTVRSALRRLEKDGLIESIPRWGVRIPIETEESIRQRYEVREILEEGAIRLAMNRIRPDDAKRLLELARIVDESTAASPPDAATFAEKHAELHVTIIELSGNKLLAEAYERVNIRSQMLHNANRAWFRILQQGPRHHQSFIEKLLESDEDTAARLVREHVKDGLRHELEALRASLTDNDVAEHVEA